MSNQNWYNHPGGWGVQPLGQGRDIDNRGARQRRSFDDDDYELVGDGDYRCREANEQDYETRRRAIFQVHGDRETNSPPLQRENGPGGGGRGLQNQGGAPHPNVTFGIMPQGQAGEGAYQAPTQNALALSGPQLGLGMGPPVVGAPVPPAAAAQAAGAPAPIISGIMPHTTIVCTFSHYLSALRSVCMCHIKIVICFCNTISFFISCCRYQS